VSRCRSNEGCGDGLRRQWPVTLQTSRDKLDLPD
jgi:hypothetical protein